MIEAWSGTCSTNIKEDEDISKFGIIFELFFSLKKLSEQLELNLSPDQAENVRKTR